jgi:hypothetical protein
MPRASVFKGLLVVNCFAVHADQFRLGFRLILPVDDRVECTDIATLSQDDRTIHSRKVGDGWKAILHDR